MSITQGFRVKTAFYYALVGSVGISALLGIMALLSGRFGWFEVRVLLTTVAIASASVCGLACGAYLSTRRGHVLPLAGIGLTLLASILIVAGIWATPASFQYWQLAAAAAVFSVACAHLSLLSMARLAEWFQWSLTVAYVTIFGVASLIVLMMRGEAKISGMFQLLGVAAIFDAAITILIPIFHRLSKEQSCATSTDADRVGNSDAEIAALKARLEELERTKHHRA